ncbi:intradiol ring-cleavage dioxygenase [Flavobacterium piscis]|uniref:Protocatechuate 3,4-dioxygenase beta subunit n=1 Tax=Flavobacterium piscis TaxID=1114874 RepID=A0ABU1Y7X0_9FLAO|nr:intradiol ring-cleavage dioxygenase [Flavobacterium piscis]MDR7210306.1 protocatechuate 3,4-dioxygenase beta subunit [Flavobacterium piscis]
MDRKEFLRNGLLGLGVIVALPTVVTSCSNDDERDANVPDNPDNCAVSPTETIGPFPILTPLEYIRASIIGDRTGVPLLMTLTIQDQSNGCTPLAGVYVDVWQCDKDGNYSQYGGNSLQTTNYTNQNFLRGRQTTNANGQVSFISIFPGWYPGRAPHIHVEVRTTTGTSLLVTQIAFPTTIYAAVYETSGYNGAPDRSNTQDSIFSNSLSQNMADSVTGNITDGYMLLKTITVI